MGHDSGLGVLDGQSGEVFLGCVQVRKGYVQYFTVDRELDGSFLQINTTANDISWTQFLLVVSTPVLRGSNRASIGVNSVGSFGVRRCI